MAPPTDRQRQAVDAYRTTLSIAATARELGISRTSVAELVAAYIRNTGEAVFAEDDRVLLRTIRRDLRSLAMAQASLARSIHELRVEVRANPRRR